VRKLTIVVLTALALATGTAAAQSPYSIGVSLAYTVFPLPIPLVGVHVGFENLIAKDVGLRLNLSGIAFGVDGGWFAGGTAGTDVIWQLPAGGAAAVQPYAGGGAGLLFAGGGSGADLGIELAPYVGGVAGVSVPLEDLSVFVEVRGNAAFGFFGLSPWWLSLAVGLAFGL